MFAHLLHSEEEDGGGGGHIKLVEGHTKYAVITGDNLQVHPIHCKFHIPPGGQFRIYIQFSCEYLFVGTFIILLGSELNLIEFRCVVIIMYLK